MDDWNGRLSGMARRLDEWNAVYESEYARLSKQRRGWFRSLGRAEIEMIGRDARAAAGTELLDEFSTFLDELCDHYVEESLSQERAKIRKRVGEEPALLHFLWSYVTRGPVLVRTREDEPSFRRALAAASISVPASGSSGARWTKPKA